MSAAVRFSVSETYRPANERVAGLLSACAHYNPLNRPLFTSAYNELCRLELKGGRILEVCCGYGELACNVARALPQASIIAVDRYPEAGQAIRDAQANGLQNVSYHAGNALSLPEFPDGSFDVIFGQAALHHLTHDLASLTAEFSRLLKPGGRLIFIFEPFGHNPFWSMLRAFQVARGQMTDESNLYLGQFEEVGKAFSACEVQPFNLLGYPLKAFARLGGNAFISAVTGFDRMLMHRFPSLCRQAANVNVIFSK